MKILTFLFLTINVVFFMWQYHSGSFLPPMKENFKGRSDLAPIVLVEENKSLAVNTENAGSYSVKKFRVISDFQPIEKVVEPAPSIENIHKQPLHVSQVNPEAILNPGLGEKPVVPAESFVVKNQKAEVSSAINEDQEKKQAEININEENLKGSLSDTDTEDACYEIGPFGHQSQYFSWLNTFKGDYVAIKLIRREEPQSSGYFVYYPAEDTLEKSGANVEMLKDKGIEDYWVITEGETRGEISLGFLRTLERAEMLKKELLDKGVKAFIRPIFKDSNVIYAWVKTLRKKGFLTGSHENWRRDNPDLSVKATESCPTL